MDKNVVVDAAAVAAALPGAFVVPDGFRATLVPIGGSSLLLARPLTQQAAAPLSERFFGQAGSQTALADDLEAAQFVFVGSAEV